MDHRWQTCTQYNGTIDSLVNSMDQYESSHGVQLMHCEKGCHICTIKVSAVSIHHLNFFPLVWFVMIKSFLVLARDHGWIISLL